MFITSRLLGLVLLGSILLSGNAWAAGAAVGGIVKDQHGQAVKGADIRIESKDGSGWHKMSKTDAKGHYAYTGLADGTYRVSLVVGGAVKASINNVKVKAGEPQQLNFDLKPGTVSQAGPGKKTKHLVYMPAQTGSNLGGRWVEVDDTGAPATGSERLEKIGGAAVGKMQSNSGATLNGSGGN